MKFSIRKATPADVKKMTELLGHLFSIETDFVAHSEKQENGLRLLLERVEDNIVLAADLCGNVVGMVTGQLAVSTAEGGFSLKVEDLVVFPEYRNKGIGKALLKELSLWGLSKGALRMELLADRANLGALEFYKKLGWKATSMICWHLLPVN
jgi:GNAT superfamily N-acetyltransferase